MTNKVYEIITSRIIEQMSKGNVPWRKPWTPGEYANRPSNYSGRAYHGVNFFLMNMLGYTDNIFLTYKQIADMQGKIKEEETKNFTPVFFWSWVKKTRANADQVDEGFSGGTFPLFRYFRVYNISQCEGIELPKWYLKRKEELAKGLPTFSPIESAEKIVAGYKGAPVINKAGGDRACYYPSRDAIDMPMETQFDTMEGYYATLFHELGHSTGHQSRLNRKELTSAGYFGSHEYSKEELVAELTSAFLCAESGIDNTKLETNSAAYLQSWMRSLKNDPKMFSTAAARAQKAAELILGKAEQVEQKTEDQLAEEAA